MLLTALFARHRATFALPILAIALPKPFALAFSQSVFCSPAVVGRQEQQDDQEQQQQLDQ